MDMYVWKLLTFTKRSLLGRNWWAQYEYNMTSHSEMISYYLQQMIADYPHMVLSQTE